MAEELKALYLKQEQERHRLRVRHRVELDKLMILYEQEMLRCYNRIFREENGLSAPLSFCAVVKDDELYSTLKTEQQVHDTPFTFPVPATTNSSSSIDGNPATYEDKLLAAFNEIKTKFINFRV